MPGPTTAGLSYEVYDGTWSSLPDFSMLTPVATGVADNFDIGVSGRTNTFGMVFTGFIEIVVEGDHTLYLTSDEGSRLYLGGQLLIDNDGLHAATEMSETVCLRPGLHAIDVEYFERRMSEVLTVEYATPLTGRAPIPNNLLTH